MKKQTIAVATLFVVLLLEVGWWVHSRVQNRLVVRNESGQLVRLLTVTVGGETIRFENLSPGAAVSASFPIRSDDHFAVRGRLEDGTEIADDCGYVTNGMYGERAFFVIESGGRLTLTQRTASD